ncbi:reverse transcriptase domain-containing protein [Tanacetum coccineum]
MKMNYRFFLGFGFLVAKQHSSNPREDLKAIATRSGATLAGPSVPPPPPSPSKEMDQEPKTKMDHVLTKSTTNVPPSVVQPSPDSTSFEFLCPISVPKISATNSASTPIPYHHFSEALAHMPKFAKMVKDLLMNKEKLLEIANTPVNENCSAVILKKLPKKLEDTGRFLIPFPADFVVVDYEVDPRVPLILGRPFLRTAHALVDVHGEKLTLRVGDEE